MPSIPSSVMVKGRVISLQSIRALLPFWGCGGGTKPENSQEFCAPWRRKREAEEERRRAQLTAHPSAASSSPPVKWVKDTEDDDAIGKMKSKDSVRILHRELNELGDDDIETGSANKFPRHVDVRATVVNPIHASGIRGHDRTGDAAPVAKADVSREGGNLKGGEESDEETVPLGLLSEEEIKRAYDIFCGGEELDFQRFLTGLGVLR